MSGGFKLAKGAGRRSLNGPIRRHRSRTAQSTNFRVPAPSKWRTWTVSCRRGSKWLRP